MTLTLFLAIWGAGLSTFVVIRDSMRKRRRANVEISGDVDHRPPPSVSIVATIANVGHETIYLAAVAVAPMLKHPWNRIETSFAITVSPELRHGQHFSTPPIWIDHIRLQLEDSLFKSTFATGSAGPRFQIVFIDQVDRRYYSKPMYLPVVETKGSGVSVRFPWDESFWRSARLKVKGWSRLFRERK